MALAVGCATVLLGAVMAAYWAYWAIQPAFVIRNETADTLDITLESNDFSPGTPEPWLRLEQGATRYRYVSNKTIFADLLVKSAMGGWTRTIIPVYDEICAGERLVVTITADSYSIAWRR